MARVLVVSGFRAADGPYGIDVLEELGYELVEVASARWRWHRKIRDVIEHRTHIPSDDAVRSSLLAARSDVVLTFLEGHGIVPSWWKAHRLPPYSRRPLAMIACWLADELSIATAGERRAVAHRYRGVDLTIVFSENQLDILYGSGFRKGTVEAVPFGFSSEQHIPGPPGTRSGRIAAVGFDRGRDYRTLCDAVRGTELAVDLYCKPSNIDGIDLPSNVSFHGTVPYDEYRRVLREAGVVAVPTRVMQYPSGQTVALEAAATGACVALTDTPALSEYFSPRTALMFPPGDEAAWRAGLLAAHADPASRARLGEAARDHVMSRFTYRHMWSRIDELFKERGWVSPT